MSCTMTDFVQSAVAGLSFPAYIPLLWMSLSFSASIPHTLSIPGPPGSPYLSMHSFLRAAYILLIRRMREHAESSHPWRASIAAVASANTTDARCSQSITMSEQPRRNSLDSFLAAFEVLQTHTNRGSPSTHTNPGASVQILWGIPAGLLQHEPWRKAAV